MTDNGISGLRVTLHSQVSVDSTQATPKSRGVLSVIGITRKRSSANTKEDKSARTSFNSQTSLIRESSPDTATPPRSVNGSGKDRLCVSNVGTSRPSSGQFLPVTSTPNHSRSPSISSNRDSMQSSDGLLVPGSSASMTGSDPPPVPPKSRHEVSSDELSVSITESGFDPICLTRKKKAPPPPPPTSPKKPPLRSLD